MFLLIESVVIKFGTFQRFFSIFETGLLVLDNWVLGFSSIRWMSLLLLAISESKSHVQLSLWEIVGGGRGDTYAFWFLTSADFITIAFEIQ